MSRKKLTGLSIEQKIKIIKDNDEKINKKTICEKYKCDLSTVNRILKKKDEIKQQAISCPNVKRNRDRKGVHEDIENSIAMWFDQQRGKTQL